MAGVVQDVGIAGRPGPSVQEMLNRETRLVAAALRQEFNDSLGTEDLDKERYYAREFYRLEEDPDAQVRFAEAAAAIDAARLQLQRNFAELMEDARAGTPVSLERRAQYRFDASRAIDEAWQAGNTVMAASGGTAIFLDNPLQRAVRTC